MQYRVVLFDASTSTEYERLVEAPDEEAAIAAARQEILVFIYEMEGVLPDDAYYIERISEDLRLRSVSQA